MTPLAVSVSAVGPDDAHDLVDLFDREHHQCYCRYWHFGGSNKEWEARCALDPAQNRAALEQAITSGNREGRGVVARLASSGARQIVGWLKLAPRDALVRLQTRAPYRDLPVAEEGIYSIGCLYVEARSRHLGVARALVEGAIECSPEWGARFLEAYPRVSSEQLHDHEVWTGPASLYESLGFEVVHGRPPYPTLRRAVSHSGRL